MVMTAAPTGIGDGVATCGIGEACMTVVALQDISRSGALHVSSGLSVALALLQSQLMHVYIACRCIAFVVLQVEAGLLAVVLVSVEALSCGADNG